MSNFSLDVSKFCEDAKENNCEIIRATAIALFRSVILGTPVDTGRARANWFASGASASNEINESGDKSGNVTIEEMTTRVQALKDSEVIQLTNNLPYIKRLEDGYSGQAPAGMVKVNILRFEKLLAAEAKKRQI